ncbi:MAG: hypothetical protein ACLSDO_03950 [Anaerotruncus colihominis]
MNVMDGIAATASTLASAQLQQNYAIAVSKGDGSQGLPHKNCCKCPASPALAISLMSAPEQK